jgi:hypothetical protein
MDDININYWNWISNEVAIVLVDCYGDGGPTSPFMQTTKVMIGPKGMETLDYVTLRSCHETQLRAEYNSRFTRPM